MRVIIIGAGEVGYHLAERLSLESQDVVIVDTDPERAQRASELLDVMTVVGNGASIPVLEDAGIRDARMLLAVTSKDEVNLISCLAASRLGVDYTIARISNPDYYARGSVLSRERLGIDLMINPEREAARETFQLLQSAAATDVANFAHGQVQLVGLVVKEGAPVAGKSVARLAAELKEYHFVLAAIVRDDETIIPTGSSTVEAGDHIYVLSPSSEVAFIPPLAGYDPFDLKRVMIAGGSAEGLFLAELLEKARDRVHHPGPGPEAVPGAGRGPPQVPGPARRRHRHGTPGDGGRGGAGRLRGRHRPRRDQPPLGPGGQVRGGPEGGEPHRAVRLPPPGDQGGGRRRRLAPDVGGECDPTLCEAGPGDDRGHPEGDRRRGHRVQGEPRSPHRQQDHRRAALPARGHHRHHHPRRAVS